MTPRVAVVGHVEWTTIVRARRLPTAGEICGTEVVWEGPAGGGAVAAARGAAITGGCAFFTRLGDDEQGVRSQRMLTALGVTVLASTADAPTSRAVSIVDGSGERTTLTIGARLAPAGTDALPWDELAYHDAVYLTAGDRAAVRHARRAALLAATARELAVLSAAAVPVDLLVGSGCDPDERYRAGAFARSPGLRVTTAGPRGGWYVTADGRRGRYRATEPPGPLVDAYGVGDNFAASLTVALAGAAPPATALAAAAVDGAACTAIRGPYARPGIDAQARPEAVTAG